MCKLSTAPICVLGFILVDMLASVQIWPILFYAINFYKLRSSPFALVVPIIPYDWPVSDFEDIHALEWVT